MTHLPSTTSATTVGTTVLLTLTLAACGGAPAQDAGQGEQPTSPTAEDTAAAVVHNDADTRFAQMMIVHHEDAVEMAELAIERAGSAEVRALAGRIAAAPGPEIETLTSWLEAWGEELTDPSGMEGMEGMEPGDTPAGGMDQDAVMAELSQLTGTDFDRRFLEVMTEHHRGAVEMAEQHRQDGENPQALRLSGDIIDAQTLEIAEMTNLLREL